MELPGPVAGRGGLLVRGFALILGAVLVAGSALAIAHEAVDRLNPEPGDQQQVTERVSYWTDDAGAGQTLRPRTTSVQDSGGRLQLIDRVEGVHSPRGDRFPLQLEERFGLADKEGGFAAFPPTPRWQEPPEMVHLGVPWRTADGVQVPLFDSFHRLHEVERDGLTLVKYKANEPNQFFVESDTVWFRNVERTVLVEPVTGTVVDYRAHETIWEAPRESSGPLGLFGTARENREKVWEATVEPTPASQQALAERAEHQLSAQLEAFAWTGGPLLAVGELAMAAAMLGRPRRLMPGSGS